MGINHRNDSRSIHLYLQVPSLSLSLLFELCSPVSIRSIWLCSIWPSYLQIKLPTLWKFLFLVFIFCSGRLIRTLANVQYRNYHLTPVEIIYNIFSFIVAIITTVAFTIYARRTLDELKAAEANGEGSSPDNNGRFEMHKLPLEKYKNSFSLP